MNESLDAKMKTGGGMSVAIDAGRQGTGGGRDKLAALRGARGGVL